MTIKVVATGDSLFTADFPPEYETVRGPLDAFLSDADVRITNLETNLSDFGTFANRYSGGTWLNTRKEAFPSLESFGFNFYGTANNHAMDYSYAGLLSTVDFLDEKGNADGFEIAVLKVFAARPGVNYLRHETSYTVSEKDLADLKRIADATAINACRDAEIATGYMLPDPEGTFVFGDTAFTTDKDVPRSRCNKGDLARLCGNIEKAKTENDLVFLLVHCHDEEGETETDPPAYLKEFCRAAIDAGASAVFGGGVHVLRGLEIYRGKPVFYSLGDFIYQGMRVEYLPPDFMEKYGLDVDATAKEALRVRSRDGKIGLQTNEKNFLSVVPKLTFEDGVLRELTMMPVKLGFKTGSAEGEKIFSKYRELSAALGTELAYENGFIKAKE